jgi:hypothetical protein
MERHEHEQLQLGDETCEACGRALRLLFHSPPARCTSIACKLAREQHAPAVVTT